MISKFGHWLGICRLPYSSTYQVFKLYKPRASYQRPSLLIFCLTTSCGPCHKVCPVHPRKLSLRGTYCTEEASNFCFVHLAGNRDITNPGNLALGKGTLAYCSQPLSNDPLPSTELRDWVRCVNKDHTAAEGKGRIWGQRPFYSVYSQAAS